MEINGATAIITGGASGLGEATARRLHSRGAKVLIMDINAEKGEELVKRLGERAVFALTDVTVTEQVQAAVKLAVERFGQISIAVNCAGGGSAGRTISREGPYPLERFKRVVDLNLVGTFDTIRLAAFEMAENEPNADGERGVIVNTSSDAAFEGQIGQVAYTASKAAIAGMTLTIARDLASVGIRVCTIAPGFFRTPMVARMTEQMQLALLRQTPFPNRGGQPDEFAMLVQQIVENPMLNGETIRLDGGMRMQPK